MEYYLPKQLQNLPYTIVGKYKVYENPLDSFVGSVVKTKHTELKVIGSVGSIKIKKPQLYVVKCEKCAQDDELFPCGVFLIPKSNLECGQTPCGCAHKPTWTNEQYKVRLTRHHGDKIEFLHYPPVIKKDTRLLCRCKLDGHTWEATPDGLLNSDHGCRVCGFSKISEKKTGVHRRKDYKEKLDAALVLNSDQFVRWESPDGYTSNKSFFYYKCLKHNKTMKARYDLYVLSNHRCKYCSADATAERLMLKDADSKLLEKIKHNGDAFIKWEDDHYKGKTSRFYYECPKHGPKVSNYHNYVVCGSRCKQCFYEETGNNGFMPSRKDEKDYLYVMTSDAFIKVGRSINPTVRLKQLKRLSEIDDLRVLSLTEDTHENIYKLEQYIHSELRKLNKSYFTKWSTECFTKDSLQHVYNIIKERGKEWHFQLNQNEAEAAQNA